MLSTSSMLFVTLGAIFALSGLASVVTGKVYMMGKSVSDYTEESLRKFAVPMGLSNLLTGVGLILCEVWNDPLFTVGSFTVQGGYLALMVLGIIACVIYSVCRKDLVKK